MGAPEIDSEGNKRWFDKPGLNRLHREDGPAIEYINGDKFWYYLGNVHRIDGPAIEYPSGTKCWLLDGKWHREDGPAIERSNGEKEWCFDNKRYTFTEWLKLVPFKSEEERILFYLKWK